MQVVGQAEPTVEGRPKIVRQFDSPRRLWLRFEQIDRLPEYLAKVGAIDLVGTDVRDLRLRTPTLALEGLAQGAKREPIEVEPFSSITGHRSVDPVDK